MFINQSPFSNENKNQVHNFYFIYLKSCMNVFVFVGHLSFVIYHARLCCQECSADSSYGLNQYVVKIMNSKNM